MLCKTMIDQIINKIESGPAVLFLGQNYLSLNSTHDAFLKRVHEKYGAGRALPRSYTEILDWGLAIEAERVLPWMNLVANNISVPDWLKLVSGVSWASIYTSAIDNVLERGFENDWRIIQQVTNERFTVVDPRNKTNLHITYLNGSIFETEPSKRPPLSRQENVRRKSIASALLNRIPEIVTPKGVLIVDALGTNDQLDLLDLISTIYQLGDHQALICSAGDLREHQDIKDLETSKKIILEDRTFAQVLADWILEDKIQLSNPTEEEYYGRWLTLPEGRVNIPQNRFSTISRTATVLDDDIFDNPYNNDDLLESFKRFLSSSNAAPAWFGYPRGFAFKRSYFETLWERAISRLKSNNLKDLPIILHGQSSSGKTTMLGLFAYQIRTELKYPVIYIEKRYQKIDESEIDGFCQWLEDNGAKYTFILWDGMQSPEIYVSLLKRLNTRGRNIILIGTSYTTTKLEEEYKHDPSYVESPIVLSASEKKDFGTFLQSTMPIISNILSGINDRNFLSMLYRYIPDTRPGINRSLAAELEFFTSVLANQTVESETRTRSDLYEKLATAGLEVDPELHELNRDIQIDNERLSLADQLIFSVMVPGQFGLNVPFELILRIVGFDSFNTSLFKALNQINLIEWYEYSQGEFQLGPRTSIEAKIITKYLGKQKTEAAFIRLLLMNIYQSQTYDSGETDYQIQFAIDLLNKVGPNSNDKFKDLHLYNFAEELRTLRENNIVYHPRLILKEAFFLREITKGKLKDLPESNFQILDRAEDMVRGALDELAGLSTSSIKMFLKVELASILGTKSIQYAKSDNLKLAKESYNQIKEIIDSSFISNPENYGALDVIGWSTMDLIELNAFNEAEKFQAEGDLANLIDVAELEGVSDSNLGDFDRMKLRFYSMIQQQNLADEAFERLKASGLSSGYYLRAKEKLGYLERGDEAYYKRNVDACEYLRSNYDQIKNDYRCLFLLFRCWWTSKTKSVFFEAEKQRLPLSLHDWEYCLTLLNRLAILDNKFSPTIYYIKAIAEFHLEQYPESYETFYKLDVETNFSIVGKRRVAKTFLASDPDGSPKVYTGHVYRSVNKAKGDTRGSIAIPGLHRHIPFLLRDFQKSYYQEGERIRQFYIAFNFRGPIAVEIKTTS